MELVGLNEFEELMDIMEKNEPAVFNDNDYHFKLADLNVKILILQGQEEIREALDLIRRAILGVEDHL